MAAEGWGSEEEQMPSTLSQADDVHEHASSEQSLRDRPTIDYSGARRPSTAPAQTSSLSMPAETEIVLDVGGRKFATSINTLNGASYFKSKFSGRWPSSQGESHFVDADPELFEHILRYLRRQTPPLFYDKYKGFDFHKYIALLYDAKYFGVEGLVEYLQEKRYLQTVKVVHEATVLYPTTHDKQVSTLDDMVSYSIACTVKKVHICPLGHADHRGHPRTCRQHKCSSLKEAECAYEEEVVVNILKVNRRVEINLNHGS